MYFIPQDTAVFNNHIGSLPEGSYHIPLMVFFFLKLALSKEIGKFFPSHFHYPVVKYTENNKNYMNYTANSVQRPSLVISPITTGFYGIFVKF